MAGTSFELHMHQRRINALGAAMWADTSEDQLCTLSMLLKFGAATASEVSRWYA